MQHGLAIQSFRSLSQSRFHLQVSCNDILADWPDERIWTELKHRLTLSDQSWAWNQGPITERHLFQLRHSVTFPMQYKRLFLLGDAAHVVPPTGAKGLNIAVKDAHVLAQALVAFYEDDQWDRLNNFSATCLPHVWQAQEFADYMTSLLHKMSTDDNIDDFDQQLHRARQRTIQHSNSLQHYIAEMIVHPQWA